MSEFDEGLGKAATFIATMASAAGNLIATIEGVTDAASAAGAEMSALEKASVVLTAISAGFQLIQGAFSLFGGGESSWERNIRLAHEFNEELRLMNERVKINAEEFSNIFGKDEYGAFIQNIEVARKALKDYEESLEEIKKRGEEKTDFQVRVQLVIQVYPSYINMKKNGNQPQNPLRICKYKHATRLGSDLPNTHLWEI